MASVSGPHVLDLKAHIDYSQAPLRVFQVFTEPHLYFSCQLSSVSKETRSKILALSGPEYLLPWPN